MLAYIIYFIIFIILIFVLSIAVKAITRGVEAKQLLNEEKKSDLNDLNQESVNQDLEVINQIKELKKLRDEGALSDDEFIKAKEKILK